jgi:predicted kinase
MMKRRRLEEYFIDNYTEIFRRMKDCDHGNDGSLNPYHLEGSVWNHTQMVLDALGAETNSTLLLAALLHDVGKPFVRVVEGDRVWFSGHTGRGAMEAIDIVKDVKANLDDFSDANTVYVLNLISLHHLFFNYLLSEITEGTARKLYEKLKYFDYEFVYLLYKLCLADRRGRLTTTGSDCGRIVRLFSLVNSLLYSAYQNPLKDREYTNEVIFNVGIPYSGKSYGSAGYGKNYTVISRDDLITDKFKQCTYNEAWELVDHNLVNAELLDNLRKAVRNRENVVVDMTNLSRKSRNTKRCVFPPSYKKTANVYYTGLSTVRSRVGKRTDKYVPWSVVEEKMNSYSTPLYDEFDEINFIVQ